MPQRQVEDEGPDSVWNVVGQHAGWGLTIAGAMGFFLFLGYQVDQRIGTMPLLTILGAFLGGGAGFYSMYRRLVVGPAERRTRDRDAKEKEGKPSDRAS